MYKFYRKEMESLKFSLFVLVCSLINYAELYQTTQGQCKTPDNKPGLCMRVRDCQPILNIIQNSPKPMPVAIKNKLKEYRCAYGANVPTVCCTPHPIHMEEAASPAPTLDITGHKNFNLLPKECGSALVTNKISRGTETCLLEYPWTVLLLYKDRKPKFHCIGTIINENYILTAAHCLVGTPPLIGVRVGEYDLSSEDDCDYHTCLPAVQNLVIEKIIPHPEFNAKGRYENDIGLIRVPKIKLNREISESTDAICLPTTPEIGLQNFKLGTVTGWAFNNPNGNTATGKLQATELPMQNLTSCENAYANVPGVKLSQKQLCVGGVKEKISCVGDTGGALQRPYYFNEDVRYFQHGVMSIGGRYCRENGSLNIYTKVIYYMNWILDNMEP